MHPTILLFLTWRPSWLKAGITGHNFGRGLSKDHSTKVWLQLAQWFLKGRFLCEFPIGLKCRTQFWKGITQGSFQQSLVEIGSVVSERIFLNFISPFSIFSLADILVGSRDHRTLFWRGTIQGSFHQSLVAISPVVSEEKIFM